jgi:hypothetical protein
VSFKSVLKQIGEDFKKGLGFLLPLAETSGAVAVKLFAPELGPMYNSTVAAVALAEQNFAAVGKQNGTGAQKLAAVTQIIGGLLKQGLEDAGKASDEAAVQAYINAVVQVLNAAPSHS